MLTLKTTELQSLINKALKGASHNILYPTTTMVDIDASNGVLKLTTTDSKNYLIVKTEIPKDMTFGAALPIDTFAKLILKTTSETISIDVVDNTLKVTGNGTYTIGLTSVYENEVTRFYAPELTNEENRLDYVTELDIAKIRAIVSSNSSSLSETLEFQALTGYYMDAKQTISTDGIVITRNSLGMFEKPVLISKELMSLLTLIEEEKASVCVYEDLSIKVETKTMDIVGHLMEEITDYPVDTVNGLVDELNTRKKAQNAARNDNPEFDEKEYALGFTQIAITVSDLKEFVDEVSDENKNTMERICRMAGGLGIIVVCSGLMADITRYNEIESLTKVIVANQNGLVTGGTPAQCPYFESNLKFSERDIEAGEGNAYAFSGGNCVRIKLPNQE